MNSEKKLKILDIILVSLMALMLLVVMSLVIFHPTAQKLALVIIGLLVLILIALSTYRCWLTYPELTGMKAPLFVPKVIGFGWAVNPRNPIGMALTIVVSIVLVVVFGVALFN
ncbi:hypothetical protein [Leuconostoc palmae]|uniref:hypothetical protein n=1 Tax=Leuconostoc palmae TaxID=501487 RepID=UPI001C7DF669|nr:hypothetical protein [Leuconostoc palmae]